MLIASCFIVEIFDSNIIAGAGAIAGCTSLIGIASNIIFKVTNFSSKEVHGYEYWHFFYLLS